MFLGQIGGGTLIEEGVYMYTHTHIYIYIHHMYIHGNEYVYIFFLSIQVVPLLGRPTWNPSNSWLHPQNPKWCHFWSQRYHFQTIIFGIYSSNVTRGQQKLKIAGWNILWKLEKSGKIQASYPMRWGFLRVFSSPIWQWKKPQKWLGLRSIKLQM